MKAKQDFWSFDSLRIHFVSGLSCICDDQLLRENRPRAPPKSPRSPWAIRLQGEISDRKMLNWKSWECCLEGGSWLLAGFLWSIVEHLTICVLFQRFHGGIRSIKYRMHQDMARRVGDTGGDRHFKIWEFVLARHSIWVTVPIYDKTNLCEPKSSRLFQCTRFIRQKLQIFF